MLTFMGKHPKRLWMFCFASTYTAFMASNCSYTMTRSPSPMQGGGAPRTCFLCRTMAVAPVDLINGASDHVFVSVVKHFVFSSRPPLELANKKVHRSERLLVLYEYSEYLRCDACALKCSN